MQGRLEKLLLREFPNEVESVFARTGTAEIATDPMGPNISDTYVMLKPRNAWTRASTQEELAEQMEEAIAAVAGQSYEFSQPIELRFNELIAGVRSDLAVKVFGDDLETMTLQANRIARVLDSIPGAADVKSSKRAACRCSRSTSIAKPSPASASQYRRCAGGRRNRDRRQYCRRGLRGRSALRSGGPFARGATP